LAVMSTCHVVDLHLRVLRSERRDRLVEHLVQVAGAVPDGDLAGRGLWVTLLLGSDLLPVVLPGAQAPRPPATRAAPAPRNSVRRERYRNWSCSRPHDFVVLATLQVSAGDAKVATLQVSRLHVQGTRVQSGRHTPRGRRAGRRLGPDGVERRQRLPPGRAADEGPPCKQVLDELGYQAERGSPGPMRNGRSGLIALVLPELDVPYFAELTRAVIEQAALAGYTVVVDQTDGDPVRERELVMRGNRAAMFDGLIFNPLALSGARPAQPAVVGRRLVLLGERVVEGGLDHIMIDNVGAAELATRHLIELGRQRIAAIGDQFDETRQTGLLRTQGYRAALQAAGRSVVPELVRPPSSSTRRRRRRDGRAARAPRATRRGLLLQRPARARRPAHHPQPRPPRPDDIALVGFDDNRRRPLQHPQPHHDQPGQDPDRRRTQYNSS